MKMVLLIVISAFIFNACTSTKYTNNLNNIEKLNTEKKLLTISYCTNNAYIKSINDEKYGKLFVEYIWLDNSCTWNGLSRGFFEYQLKKDLKVSSMKIVERLEYSNYEFTSYLIDNKYYVDLIYKYSNNEDLFILDYKGLYFQEQIQKFKKDFKSKSLGKKRLTKEYFKSLVRMNIVENYFEKVYIRDER
ncbi:hypothetical protein ACOJTA_04335 [Malaciobacter sp. WC5094]